MSCDKHIIHYTQELPGYRVSYKDRTNSAPSIRERTHACRYPPLHTYTRDQDIILTTHTCLFQIQTQTQTHERLAKSTSHTIAPNLTTHITIDTLTRLRRAEAHQIHPPFTTSLPTNSVNPNSLVRRLSNTHRGCPCGEFGSCSCTYVTESAPLLVRE